MNRNMLAKLNTMSIGDSLTGVVTESTGRLYWGITRLTQVQYELVLTRPFGKRNPNWLQVEVYTIRQLVGMDSSTGAISAAGIAKSVMAA